MVISHRRFTQVEPVTNRVTVYDRIDVTVNFASISDTKLLDMERVASLGLLLELLYVRIFLHYTDVSCESLDLFAGAVPRWG